MLKFIKTIIILLLIFKLDTIYSQVNQEWSARYSGLGSSIDGGKSVLIDKSNNVIVGGSSYNVSNNYDYTIIKYNNSGVQQWLVTYNGTGNDHDILTAMVLDDLGNVYVTGSSVGIGTGQDITTIKYNKLGVQQWVVRTTSSGNHDDAGYALSIDNKFNIYVTGELANNIGGIDCPIIKYDSAGNQLWFIKYNRGVNSSNRAFDMTIDDSNSIFVAGTSNGDFITLKYNSYGIKQWDAFYNSPLNLNDEATALKIDSTGNVYVSGTSGGGIFYYDYALIKYNSFGEEQWVRRYNGTSNYEDHINDMVIDKYGNAYVTGYSTESGQGYNMTTIKYNTFGDTLWKASYHNGPNDIAYAIELDNDGNVYVTGESDGSGTNGDYTTVKYNSLGQQQWVKRYNFSGQYGDSPLDIAVNNNGSVFVTGSSDRDILTVKYSQLTGATIKESIIPTEYNLSQNYPNPFNPVTSLEFQIPKSGFVTLKIYDMLGKEISTIVYDNLNPGTYRYEFNGSNFASGVYFYKLVLGDFTAVKRMVLIK